MKENTILSMLQEDWEGECNNAVVSSAAFFIRLDA